MITRSRRRSNNNTNIITTIIHKIVSFMIGPEYESWDHTLQTTYITHLQLQHEGTHVPYHIQHNSNRAWLGWIHCRASNILRNTNMVILAFPPIRQHVWFFRSHFSTLISRYRLYSYDDMVGTHHHMDDQGVVHPLPHSPQLETTFTIRFYTINCHTHKVTHSIPAVIKRHDIAFQTARPNIPGTIPIATHDEHGQPWATGYYSDGTPHPDSPHQTMNQPPLTPTPPTTNIPADVYTFPISLRTLKQIRRIRVQHILQEYMWNSHSPPTSYGLEISDCRYLGQIFTAMVNEQHHPGPRPRHDTDTTPYTRIIFRTARARRGYTQPLPQTTDAAADVYITFPTRHITHHTRLWDSLREVAKLITYAPQYDQDRQAEILIQLRNDGANTGR